ncbi:cation diffusion facilitator family transporter [Clostridium sp. JN-1]|jgi:cation diffusion facilitator family transporter|uniref:cation diffusion facilitator family transporter n=1 Tax=Clostridium sp. JN-1 TaxID=2483110 RepID=UPI000F0BCAC9|nr:cation diffusion facilitator family transporter [Clostridium sp. JN-1]
MEENYKNLKIAERGAQLGLIVYIVLTIFKLTVGYFSKSEALIADGFNNSTDIIASISIIIGLKISRKPADEDHAYGHLRAETIASLIASLIMIAVSLEVIYSGIHSVIFFKKKAPDMIAAIVAIICALAIYIVYRYNMKVSIKVRSSALKAAAKDNLSDAFVGIGTALGIIASQFGFPWIDPLAAIVVGILIFKTGFSIFKEASHNLTDGFDKNELDGIISKIKKVRGVNKIKDIKARVHGNSILLDVIISVDPNLTVIKSHKITEEIETMLAKEFKIKYAIVHVEPDLNL